MPFLIGIYFLRLKSMKMVEIYGLISNYILTGHTEGESHTACVSNIRERVRYQMSEYYAAIYLLYSQPLMI